VRPQSYGHIELASADPEDDVRLHYGVLSDPAGADRALARKALRFTLHFVELFQDSSYPHPTKLAYAPEALVDRASGSGDKDKDEARPDWRELTDDDLDEYIDRRAVSALHFSSTCPIGLEDKGGVVDQQLRVYGFDNLRIADTSVFPKIPSCHTMGPAVMVGERCADFIKSAWDENA
jgi:choline dehydrogenase-like flavoprotein